MLFGHFFTLKLISTNSAFYSTLISSSTSGLARLFYGRKFAKQQEIYTYFFSYKYLNFSDRHLYKVDTLEQGFAQVEFILILLANFSSVQFLTILGSCQYYGLWRASQPTPSKRSWQKVKLFKLIKVFHLAVWYQWPPMRWHQLRVNQ